MAQNIQVFVRCRPLTPQERHKVIEVSPERREIKVSDKNISFHFNQVFAPDTGQPEVYDTVVRPLIDHVIQGFNCTVFAYGQTGTGKTYTMEGHRSNDDLSWEEDPDCGIIPRAISQLFNTLKDNDNEFTVRVSFLELYNEDTFDLLSTLDDTTKLKIFEDAQKKGSVIVGGLAEVIVQSKAEIYEILKRGSAKRQTAATLLNACSSRSHTIFSVTVHIREGSNEGEELLKIGKLNLVDLAGSENIGRSGAQDKRAREAGNINQSLLTLGRVITALVEKRPHIPYRESKLTRLLQDSLGGKTKTSIIATISPTHIDLEDTLSTLDYASRAKKITNKPEMNQRLTKKALLREYTQEIERLRRDLQATREKSGVYIEEENYKEMCKQLSSGNAAIKEKEDRLFALQSENEKIKTLFDDFTAQYERTKAELGKAKDYCERQKRLLSFHRDTEEKLASQAAELIQVAETATNDNYLLHSKKERIESILKENRLSIDRYHPKAKDDISRMETLLEMYAQELLTVARSRHDNVPTYRDKLLDQINSKNSVLAKKLRDHSEHYKKQAECYKKQAEHLKKQAETSLELARDLEDQAKEIEVGGPVPNLVIDTMSQLNDDAQLNVEELKKVTSTLDRTMKREINTLRQELEMFLTREIKEDIRTGTTPQKKTYHVPKPLIKLPDCNDISEVFEDKESV